MHHNGGATTVTANEEVNGGEIVPGILGRPGPGPRPLHSPGPPHMLRGVKNKR
ncbi:MAG: hypothetical protein OEM59_08770 [Rhodospirillales bacterium]|nr:hypothetical protein [Rhodospirillales bacterium]